MACLDEAASSEATGRASVAGRTAVYGVGQSAATQRQQPACDDRALLFTYLVTYLQLSIYGTFNDAVSSTEHSIE